MTFIEGVGDEVTAIFGVFLLLVGLAVMWMSTGVSALPAIHVVILDPRRWRQILQRLQRTATSTPAQTPVPEPAPEPSGITAVSGNASPDEVPTEVTPPEEVEVLSHGSVDENELTASSSASEVTPQVAPDAEQVSNSTVTSVTSDPIVSDEVTAEPATSMTQEEQEVSSSQPEPDEPSLEDIPEGHIRVRVKYLDERQKLLFASPDTTVGEFKRLNFSDEINGNFAVRFIYQGQELQADEFTLRRYNVADNSVLHCLLSRAPQPQPPTSRQPSQPDVNMGVLVLPLFGFMLAFIWYCRFAYRAYFNAISTIALTGLSFLYGLAVYASYRRPLRHEHTE